MTANVSQSIGQMPGGLNLSGEADPKDFKKAARDFEAFFVGQIFEQAHKAIPKSDFFEGASGLELYQSLFIQEAVKGAVQGGQGLGLVEFMEHNANRGSAELKPAPIHFEQATEKLAGAVSETFEMPLDNFAVSSAYGMRNDPIDHTHKKHGGVDLKAPFGSPIRAVSDGKVAFAGVLKGYGKVVKVDHGDGVETLYAHNSKNKVSVGDSVKSGQVVGYIGQSGRATGPHLHFEVRKDGENINPEALLNFNKKT